MARGDFTLAASDGSARAGLLTTAHGTVETPVFMPVGTRATVKGVDPRELEQLGAQIILGNTYHLHFRPGGGLVEELGGLHRFMGWERSLLTDSGGFQVFSLAQTRTIDADGVTFRSVYDGTLARFTPELAMAVQASLGSDIAMAFDECAPAGAPRADLERAVERTARWAERCAAAPRAAGQLRFGIVQGGVDRELRARSAGQITALPFEGYAIGGLSVGEERELMFDVTASTAALLPDGRPRYFMGIGDPEGILRVIGAGVDMFDCVLPTRLGRTGSATTWEGRLNLRNARFARDEGPLQDGCSCPACTRFSRAYIRHLITQDELLGLRLLTLHNLSFLIELCRAARSAIVTRRFEAFADEARERLGAGTAQRAQREAQGAQ
ncbi:MAG: queuine tRNA-ribosyltransferase [Gaiellales bacterium]|nr:queuine tRNA-ribosyltransferase [Gaiellales bacterium]